MKEILYLCTLFNRIYAKDYEDKRFEAERQQGNGSKRGY
jgi:hypothetical protein